MSEIRSASAMNPGVHCDVVVIGAGACGLTAALRAAEAGAEVIVVERDARASGSTAMSSGFIPAAGTRFQKTLGIDDSPALFASDIQKKASGRAEPELVSTVTSSIAPALEWLADKHGFEWVVLEGFLYPGHRLHRMHAVPEKTGEALSVRLLQSVHACDIALLTQARATTLFAGNDERIEGVEIERPDGMRETIGCKAVILACNGFGGNRELVTRYLPTMAGAPYFGHLGNQGDALLWGEKIGARTAGLSACQGHGSLAFPHNALIPWPLMMEGGIQVNLQGRRFSNEHGGYSEQAEHVLAQPEGLAWNIYDKRLHEFALGFDTYCEAAEGKAVVIAETIADLARQTGLPQPALSETLSLASRYQSGDKTDPFGRDFTTRPALQAPYCAIRVTGALFHTQGGLLVDRHARVILHSGKTVANLFAGGGAACGVSGTTIDGYLSGNGLLTAISLGWIAGHAAGEYCRSA